MKEGYTDKNTTVETRTLTNGNRRHLKILDILLKVQVTSVTVSTSYRTMSIHTRIRGCVSTRTFKKNSNTV